MNRLVQLDLGGFILSQASVVGMLNLLTIHLMRNQDKKRQNKQ